MKLSNYKFTIGKHKEKEVIWIHFLYSFDLKNQLSKQFSSVRYSAPNKSWYLPDFPAIRHELHLK